MDEKTLENVLNDKEFMVKLSQQTDLNEVKKMLDSVNICLTYEELIQLREEVHKIGRELQEAQSKATGTEPQDAQLQAIFKELQDNETQGVVGGSTAGRVAGAATGAVFGGVAGVAAAPLVAAGPALLGAHIGSRLCSSKYNTLGYSLIGLLVGGIVGATVSVAGGATLGGWGGYKVAKKLES